jgi:hypothetical protein
MFIGHLVVSLFFAALAIALLAFGLRYRGPHPLWALFLLLFLGVWAGGAWLSPIGPPLWSIYWLPFLMLAVLIATLIVAIAPPKVHTHAEEMEREREVGVGLGIFFWLLMSMLFLAILLRYA